MSKREMLLKYAINTIALLFNIALIVAAIMQIGQMFILLYQGKTSQAVQDGLFVLILLEMFFVVYMFIKQGTISVALIINIGIVAVIKEMIFHLKNLTLETSLAFTIAFLALLTGVLFERNNYFSKANDSCSIHNNHQKQQ